MRILTVFKFFAYIHSRGVYKITVKGYLHYGACNIYTPGSVIGFALHTL
jgi:hypothetical protein